MCMWTRRKDKRGVYCCLCGVTGRLLLCQQLACVWRLPWEELLASGHASLTLLSFLCHCVSHLHLPHLSQKHSKITGPPGVCVHQESGRCLWVDKAPAGGAASTRQGGRNKQRGSDAAHAHSSSSRSSSSRWCLGWWCWWWQEHWRSSRSSRRSAAVETSVGVWSPQVVPNACAQVSGCCCCCKAVSARVLFGLQLMAVLALESNQALAGGYVEVLFVGAWGMCSVLATVGLCARV